MPTQSRVVTSNFGYRAQFGRSHKGMDIKDADYLKSCSGKLMRIEGVTFADAGKKVFAAAADKDNANCVNRGFSGISTNNLVIRTSAYAKFANALLPEGIQSVTGIFTRYAGSKERHMADSYPYN